MILPTPVSTILLVLLAPVHAVEGQTRGTVFQGAMMSSGKNRPSINLRGENLINLIGLLHRGIPSTEIQSQLGLPEVELRRKLNLLVGEGLAKRVGNGGFLPSCVVVTSEDAGQYFRPDARVIEAAARLIRKGLPAVKAECRKIKSLAGVPFEAMSFFIGSDVLLDNWQIGSIEHLFVKAERPLRTGGRYYYMVFEKPAAQQAEAFGIYGNTGSQWGSIEIGLYGNDRFSNGRTLLSIPDEEFAGFFGFEPSLDLKEARRRLAERIVEASRGHMDALTVRESQAISRLGLLNGNRMQILVLEGDDYPALDRIAALVTKDLVKLLEQNRRRLMQVYSSSPYAEETSFNEYFICWYHFFYTAVTNKLRDEKVIDIPGNGTTTYLVAR